VDRLVAAESRGHRFHPLAPSQAVVNGLRQPPPRVYAATTLDDGCGHRIARGFDAAEGILDANAAIKVGKQAASQGYSFRLAGPLLLARIRSKVCMHAGSFIPD